MENNMFTFDWASRSIIKVTKFGDSYIGGLMGNSYAQDEVHSTRQEVIEKYTTFFNQYLQDKITELRYLEKLIKDKHNEIKSINKNLESLKEISA